MDYLELSIRVTLPPEVGSVIKKEKDRFVAEYGSKYKSDPHITLYLARYTPEGLEKLPADLEGFAYEPFSFTLLEPSVSERDGKYFYAIEVSGEAQLTGLHNRISEIASRYESSLLRDSDEARVAQGIPLAPRPFAPHITLGAVSSEISQPSLADVRGNLASVLGFQIPVTEVTAFFYGKEAGEKSIQKMRTVVTPFHSLR